MKAGWKAHMDEGRGGAACVITQYIPVAFQAPICLVWANCNLLCQFVLLSLSPGTFLYGRVYTLRCICDIRAVNERDFTLSFSLGCYPSYAKVRKAVLSSRVTLPSTFLFSPGICQQSPLPCDTAASLGLAFKTGDCPLPLFSLTPI